MLSSLQIQNYALIDSAEIIIGPGLTIITGETGAGKSILLGALALLLGERADAGLLFDKSRKCVVEGKFKVNKFQLQHIFAENDLDYSDETLIRREITPEGKSRAFVNDTPVTISFLRQVASRLVDIHSQHETLTLTDSAFQLSALDAIAGSEKLLDEYQDHFKAYRRAAERLKELIEFEAQSKKDLDYFTFQFEELDALKLKAGEQEELESELKTLENAETIKAGLSKSVMTLSGADENLIAGLTAVKSTMAQMGRYNVKAEELFKRLSSVAIELEDISAETAALEDEIVYDPARIEFINERLDTIYRLQHKHGIKDIAGLRQLRDELQEKINSIANAEEQLAEAQKAKDQCLALVMESGAKLEANREGATPALSKQIKSMLQDLGMPGAQLKVAMERTEEPRINGLNKVTFLFTANKGSDLQPLNKVASGGELSRLMLSLKALLSKSAALPTIIFDEIDTGISGDIAAKAGGIMHKMGEHMQVITITHLPQVASKGDSHLFVYKEDVGKKTVSRIRTLTDKQRVEEIAKMLSAGTPGEAAMENAKELLSN